MIQIDDNIPCYPDEFGDHRVTGPDGQRYCRLPLYRETLPNGVSYTTIDMGYSEVDDFPKTAVPEEHVFLMGDNHDKPADSRVAAERQGIAGPVPDAHLRSPAELIPLSRDCTWESREPDDWFSTVPRERADACHNRTQPVPAPCRTST